MTNGLSAPFQKLVLRGDGYDRGRALAAARGGAIRDAYQSWRVGLAAKGIADVDAYLRALLDTVMAWPHLQTLMPDVAAEMAGAADALELPIDLFYAYQCHDEEWRYAMAEGLAIGVQVAGAANKCTGFAISDDERVWAAQNLDAITWCVGRQMVLEIRQAARAALVFTFAGVVGVNGINSDGVSVCANTLMQLAPADRGVPVAFVIRGILEQPNLQEADRFLRSIRHASGQNYIVADPSGFASFECSAAGVERIDPAPNARWLGHTNHPLVSEDFAPAFLRLRETSPAVAVNAAANSDARFAVLSRLLSETGTSPTVTDLQNILRSRHDAAHPISREPNSSGAGAAMGLTVGSMVFATGPTPQLYLAYGPPTQEPFHTFGFSAGKP